MSPWCFGGVSVVCRFSDVVCPVGVLVVSQLCFGGCWRLGDTLVVS